MRFKEMRHKKRKKFEESARLSFQYKQLQIEKLQERIAILEIYIVVFMYFIDKIPFINELIKNRFKTEVRNFTKEKSKSRG